MKIAFDQNVPIGLVRVLQNFASEKQFRKISGNFTIKSAADYTPKPGDRDYQPKNDVPWLKRFADDGGKVVISGDVRMKSRPHERLALIEHGFIVIFFEWPVIAAKVKRAKMASFYHVPCNWAENGRLRWVSNKDPKLLKIEQRARGAKRRKAKEAPAKSSGGSLFEYAEKHTCPEKSMK